MYNLFSRVPSDLEPIATLFQNHISQVLPFLAFFPFHWPILNLTYKIMLGMQRGTDVVDNAKKDGTGKAVDANHALVAQFFFGCF